MADYTTYQPHPLRIQRKRTKGWRLPDGALCVTRPGRWGNPFLPKSALECGYAETLEDARILSVNAFEDWLHKGDRSEYWFDQPWCYERWQWMQDNIEQLRDKQLACWCGLDKPCHADALAKFANR